MKEISKSKKITIIIIVAAVLLIAIASTTGVALAKYITTRERAIPISSGNFAFESAHPENTADNPYYIVNNTINLAISNSDGSNFTSKITKFIVKIDGVTEKEKVNGVLQDKIYSVAGNGSAKMTTAVEIKNVPEGLHEVKIISQSPFVKTITLYFYVYTTYNESFYKVVHHDNWVELKVYVGEDNSDITVNYTGVVPDKTDTVLTSFESGTGTLKNLTAGANYTYIFFGEVQEGTNPFTLTQSEQTLKKGE